MRLSWSLLARLASLLTLLASPAFAGPYESAIARGAAARERALETGSERDWMEALELFEAAVEIQKTSEAAFELAEAAAALHFDDEAFTAYQTALELGLTGKAEERARGFVESHGATLGTLEITGPKGARVYVEERKRGELPFERPLVVSPGTVRVHVDAPGLGTWERDLVVEAGKATAVAVAIEHAAPPTAAPAPRVPPTRADAPTSKGWGPPAVIAGSSLLAAGVAGIVVTSAMLPGVREELEKKCVTIEDDQCKSALPSQQDAAQYAADRIVTLETVRWVSVGTAAVGAGALLAGLLKSSSTPESAKHALDVRVSKRALSLAWNGSF